MRFNNSKLLKEMFKFILLSMVVFMISGCSKRTCEGVKYIEGVSYKNGKLYTGECFTTHMDGSLRSIRNYNNGLDDGKWIFYYDNGEVEVEGVFSKNKRIGEWKYYYKNGNIKYLQIYSTAGNRSGTWIDYDSLGNVIRKIVQ